MRVRTTSAAACAVLLAVTALAGCNRDSGSGSEDKKVGIDLPRSDSDFWNSYQQYVKKGVAAGEVKALPLTNSQNDIGKLVANVQTFSDQGAKAVVMAPQDTGAIASTLQNLNKKKIPVISVDTRPDKGDVYMVVRADNRAYGENACKYLGEQLKGKGKVVEFQGDLSSINGRDRSVAFKSCMTKNFPKIKVFELATDWKGDVASAKLQSTLAANPDINGIYMQAGGVFLQPTLALLEQKKLLKPWHQGPHHDHLQRRHPGGVRRDQGGEDRRDHLPARRPVREVRAVLREGGRRRQDLQGGPDRPQLQHHQDPERFRGPASRAARDQGQCERPEAVGQSAGEEELTMPDAPAVHAQGIVKRFGPTVALDDVRLTVQPGESHALVGRNGAGKSTLVSVITGLHKPDAGTVTFSGEPAPAFGDTMAWQSKVACVYQKSMAVPDLTVAENLFLNNFGLGPGEAGGRWISWSGLRKRAAALLAEYGVNVDPSTRAKDLSVEQVQFVEIARALSFGARLIILDEPTAQLDARGIQSLFTKLRDLQSQGVAFLFISHHLQEVYELCTAVTVYRDARHVLTAPVADLGKADLVAAMTGESATGPVAWHAASGGRPRRRGRPSPSCGPRGWPWKASSSRSTSRCTPARSSGSRARRPAATPRWARRSSACARPPPGGSRSGAARSGRAACRTP